VIFLSKSGRFARSLKEVNWYPKIYLFFFSEFGGIKFRFILRDAQNDQVCLPLVMNQ
jgi:hypothetical protein